jgi:hypothetical protein
MHIKLNTEPRIRKAKNEISSIKDTLLDGIFTYDGNEYYCDPTFQEAVKAYLIAYATGMMAPTDRVKIRRPDRSFWFPNQAELIPFAGAVMAHVGSIWDEYWSKKDAI